MGPPALSVGVNRRFRDPWCALQVAGFRRASVQIKEIERGGLIRLGGLVGRREGAGRFSLCRRKSAACREKSREWGRLKAKVEPLLTLGNSG